MRPRTQEEILGSERVARLAGVLNPNSTPKYLRQFARENYVSEAMKFLYDTMRGVQKFEIATMEGKIVSVSASPTVRTNAARALVETGLGKEGFETGDGTIPGVIALPPLELHPGESPMRQLANAIASQALEFYVEEIEATDGSAQDEAPVPVRDVEVVNPNVVASVLARRNLRGKK